MVATGRSATAEGSLCSRRADTPHAVAETTKGHRRESKAGARRTGRTKEPHTAVDRRAREHASGALQKTVRSSWAARSSSPLSSDQYLLPPATSLSVSSAGMPLDLAPKRSHRPEDKVRLNRPHCQTVSSSELERALTLSPPGLSSRAGGLGRPYTPPRGAPPASN
jgi:hypothetical protein